MNKDNNVKNRSIAILQPEVPHYREEFFFLLNRSINLDIYVFNRPELSSMQGFRLGSNPLIYLQNKKNKGFLLYSPLPFLSNRYDTIVLMLHFAHITTWFLLLTKFIHRKKIVLWGQGISVKRYLQEEKKPDWKLQLQIALSDGVWLYMEKEREMWQKVFPRKKIVALNNTLTGIEEMLSYESPLSKEALKVKYQIKERIILIFCARFESNYRRTDLLIETIRRLDKQKFGFIIIGAGKYKPDFGRFANVHDFGAVYDTDLKRELFSIADIYYQPGWVGLSIVEAMAYGKPIFTFKRSVCTKQCVEYSYIQPLYNGMIFDQVEECVKTIEQISIQDLVRMGQNVKSTAMELTPVNMVKNAISIL